MIDPGGIANWSVTHVDWSEGKWHPKAYRAVDIRFDLIKNITVSFRLYRTSSTSKLIWHPCLQIMIYAVNT